MMPEARHLGAGCYISHGLRINSAIALPELDAARTENEPLPEISIRTGPVVRTLAGAERVSALVQIAGRDMLFEVPSVARYRVRSGEEIVVDPLSGASDKAVRLHILGTALAILCMQRGLLPLHANAIVFDGRAICFAGNSGAGKSTLTASLCKKDYEILSDDVCVVSLDETGGALCWPGVPRLKLWREAATAVGEDVSRCEQLVDGIEKYQVPLATPRCSIPRPLHRLYILPDRQMRNEGQVERLTGVAAVNAIVAHTYRGWAVAPMGVGPVQFRLATAIARNAEVFAAGRRWGLDVYAEEVGRLERHFAS
jgi:hypothetical protein